MTRKLLATIAAAAAVVSLPAGALGGSARRAGNSTTFRDSIGEDPNAPDITTIAVSNDDAGLITFQINVSNRPTFTSDMAFFLFLDTDQNPSTGSGDFQGADYAIQLLPGAVDLYKLGDGGPTRAPSQTSLTYAYTPSGPTIHVAAADLGGTKTLRFYAAAASGFSFDASGNVDQTKVHSDLAPDAGHGLFSYQVLTRLILRVTAFRTSPRPARAGRTFSASLAASENDTGGPVGDGAATCSAAVAFKRVAVVRHLVANGVASCVWRLPARARGKLLRGSITLTVRGAQVTRTFSTRVA